MESGLPKVLLIHNEYGFPVRYNLDHVAAISVLPHNVMKSKPEDPDRFLLVLQMAQGNMTDRWLFPAEMTKTDCLDAWRKLSYLKDWDYGESEAGGAVLDLDVIFVGYVVGVQVADLCQPGDSFGRINR